jgi:amino acid transporter
LLFYICGVFVIGITVPSNDPRLALNAGNALASPFVIAIQNAGIKVLPAVVNGALLASGLSAANSELFTSSRALHGLAIRGHAPRIFGHTSKHGVPYPAILTSACFATLAFMTLSAGAGQAFGYLATLGSAGGLLMWLSSCITHIRFERGLRYHNVPRSELPYSNPLNRNGAAAKYAAGLITVVLFFSGFSVFLKGNWDTGTFICTYLPVILYPIVYTTHKLYTRSPFVPYEDMRYNEYVPGEEAASQVEDGNKKSGIKKLASAIL